MKIEDFVFCFWRALCLAWQIFHEFLGSLAVESFWYSSLISHAASDLSAILINFFLFFNLLLMDVKEKCADSLSLFLTWWIDSWMSFTLSMLQLNCFWFLIRLKLYLDSLLAFLKGKVSYFQLLFSWFCMLLNLLSKYLNIKLGASPGWNSSSLSRSFCLLVRPSFLFVCFRLFTCLWKLYIIFTFRKWWLWNLFCGYLLIYWTCWISRSKIPEFIDYFSEDHFDNMYVVSSLDTRRFNLWRFLTKQCFTFLCHIIVYITAYVLRCPQ